MAWFSEADVRDQLAALGYYDVPQDLFQDFMRDLVLLAQKEEQEEHMAQGDGSTSLSASAAAAALDESSVSASGRRRKTARSQGSSLLDQSIQLFDQLEIGDKAAGARVEMWPADDEDEDDDGEGEGWPVVELPAPRPAQLGDRCCPARPASVIRPRSALPQHHHNHHNHAQQPKKIDRVARGQQYRRAWQENKPPGENKHVQLRWQVRSMLHAQKEEAAAATRASRPAAPNAYVVPTEKKRLPLRWAMREHINHAH